MCLDLFCEVRFWREWGLSCLKDRYWSFDFESFFSKGILRLVLGKVGGIFLGNFILKYFIFLVRKKVREI